MTVKVLAAAGASGASAAGSVTYSTGFRSSIGSTIIVVGHYFNTTGAAADADCTDVFNNPYKLANSILGGANTSGVAIYYQQGGQRGQGHTFTVNGPGATDSDNIAILEVIGSLGAIVYDPRTSATASDAATPFDVTWAAAVRPPGLGVVGITLNGGTSSAFTNPTGYTTIFSSTDGTQFLISHAAYKLNEAGVPLVSTARTGAITDGRELLCSFVELPILGPVDRGLRGAG